MAPCATRSRTVPFYPERMATEPVDADTLREHLSHRYTELTVVPSTGSTNADLRTAASAGAPDRTVLIAGEQTSGLGRRSRSWTSPPGGLYLSVLLRPDGVPAERLGSLTVIAGLALLRTVRELGVDAALKWPNDLLAGTQRAKCAGILCEAIPASSGGLAVIAGIGVNTAPLGEDITGPGGLPATSLAEQGVRATRTEIAGLLLSAFGELEAGWRARQGELSGFADEYRESCETLGRAVRIEGVGETRYEGDAVDIDTTGALVVRLADGSTQAFSAGDVVHARPVWE